MIRDTDRAAGTPGSREVAARCWAQPHGNALPEEHCGVAAELAGELGAELVRALRARLTHGGTSANGSGGPSEVSWYAFAVDYARAHWPGRAAHTRNETSDALTSVTRAMLRDVPGRPNEQVLHRALHRWAFLVPGPEVEIPAEARMVLQWVAKASRPLTDFHDPALARSVLDTLRRTRGGREAAPERVRRKRKILVHALHYAIEQGELGSHPPECTC